MTIVELQELEKLEPIFQRADLALAAPPLDLIPKCKSFIMPLPSPPQEGWRLIVDPDEKVFEIYEGNAAAAL